MFNCFAYCCVFTIFSTFYSNFKFCFTLCSSPQWVLFLTVLQIEYMLFVGENTTSTDDIKMCQSIQNKIRGCHCDINLFTLKTRKKRLSDLQNLNMIRVNKFSPILPAWCVKNCYPLLFSKCEIHKGRHLYRIHLCTRR